MIGRAAGEAMFDDVAEALVLADADDARSLVDLIERIEGLWQLFRERPDDHPLHAALAAAERLASGDTSALAELESSFSTARRLYSQSAGAKKAKRSPGNKAKSSPEPQSTNSTMPLAGDEELLRDFGIRAGEHLDDVDESLLSLEGDPSDSEAIDAVFRAFHTIKGMAGFLALDDISAHAHSSESLLAESRSGKTSVSSSTVQQLFAAADELRRLVVAATGVGTVTEAAETPAGESDLGTPAVPGSAGESSRPSTAAPARRDHGTVRVDESRLDALLDTIGELVISESMASSAARSGAELAALSLHMDRLDKITRELQQMATSLRMVPLTATFRRMKRLVHDVAKKADKKIDLVLRGEETELDKTVVDRIYDPLVHAMRNAVDHGIESPAERVSQGKSPNGRIELSAYHFGGSIHIEIRDDGQGLDTQLILQKARALGMVGADETPDEKTLFNLIFEPGFSTASVVTDVSGRGVGMDVVRRTVEDLRGRIELTSRPGEGTLVSIRLPVTLAIIDGMVARVGDERYIIPTLAIERSVRPDADQVHAVAGRAEMLALDDGLLPVLRLHSMFDSRNAQTDPAQAVVIIASDNGTRAGLMVCELLGQQQTVIKPLGEGIPEQSGITGAAIMPDGKVGLILDATGLVRLAHEQGGD